MSVFRESSIQGPRGPDELGDFLRECGYATAERFGVDPAEVPPVPRVVRSSSGPMYAHAEVDPFTGVRVQATVHITEEANPRQARLQIGHEAFHWICSPPGAAVFHWSHEMFAVLESVEAIKRIGDHEYVADCETHFADEATQLGRKEFFTASLTSPYAKGTYGQAWLVGSELKNVLDWEVLARLATTFDANNEPDVAAWMNGLSSSQRAAAKSIVLV